MHEEIEEEVEAFYQSPYQKPVLGSKEFIERVKQRLGDMLKLLLRRHSLLQRVRED